MNHPNARSTVAGERSGPSAPRQVGIGHSWNPSARAAGAAAARAALTGPDLRLLLVFARYGYELTELLGGVRAAAPGVPVIGCTTAGEIGPGPPESPGVVVVGLSGDFCVTTACARGLGERPRRVGEEVGAGLLPLPDRPYRTVIMLTDALAGDQQEMVRGAYGVLGAKVPLIGGGAGDDLRMVTSWQIMDGRAMQDGVVAACIGSDAPFGISVRHGWQSQGESIMVTASCGNDVHTLDDRPALDVYLDRHDAPRGIETRPDEFSGFALTRPLTVARRGDVAVRHVVGADPDARALNCGGAVPRGASVWLAHGDVSSTLLSAKFACAEAVSGLEGRAPLALLVFDCIGRRLLLGDEGDRMERRLIRHHAAGAPVAGFYSFGEIGRIRGLGGFHNQTVVALAVG